MTPPPSLLRRAALIAVAGAAALAGCDRGGGAQIDLRRNRDGKGTPVATFGQDSITAEDVKERFAEMSPFIRAGYESLDKRKEFVDGMARFELLAAEAAARGLQNDPEVVDVAKKAMVDRLLKQEFNEKATPIPDADVAAYYEAHKADYVKPEMVRLSYVFLAADAKDPKARAEKKARAQALLAEARAMPPLDFGAFARLAHENTEHEKTKPLRGDLRYLSMEELEAQYGKAIAAAAGGLKAMGELSEVIETPEGFHLLKLQGRQAALNLGVEQVKTQIQSKLLYERRTASFNAFIDSLKKKAGYKVDDKALAGIELDLKAPAKDARRAPPGYVPPVAGAAPMQ